MFGTTQKLRKRTSATSSAKALAEMQPAGLDLEQGSLRFCDEPPS